jgi:hypothetical protein
MGTFDTAAKTFVNAYVFYENAGFLVNLALLGVGVYVLYSVSSSPLPKPMTYTTPKQEK